uniref:hypothetical protein n=1 Tax=Mycobacterium sp. TaxID=1785 RepID=UPI0025FF1375
MSTGKLTEAGAKKSLPAAFDDDRKTRTVQASVRAYEAHQARKGGGGGGQVKLAARARLAVDASDAESEAEVGLV